MRKLVMFNRMSLDGFFAGPNGEIDWFINDPEVDQALHQMMQPDTLLMGRVTYELFVSFWPHVGNDPNVPEGVRQMAAELNQMTKLVFSRTLAEVTWVNTQLGHGDVVQQVEAIKEGTGADITIFGSGSIVQQLADARLIDEYLVVVTPVILGQGKPLFLDVNQLSLQLLKAKSFVSGNILLHYRQI